MLEAGGDMLQSLCLIAFAGVAVFMCLYVFVIVPLMVFFANRSKTQKAKYFYSKLDEVFFGSDEKMKQDLLEFEIRQEKEFREWKLKNNIK